jgi:short-subunit dehydrogenase
MSTLLIIAATSDIAKELARIYAKNGYDLILTARNKQDLKLFENDLKIRFNTQVSSHSLDVRNTNSHLAFFKQVENQVSGVICAAGYLGDQQKAESDFEETQKIIETNYTGIVSLLNLFSNSFSKSKKGFIVGISSVAGDRGRKKNYIYGAAKAAFSCYLSGLRNRLHQDNVSVLTVKPGFVDTKMTKGLDLPEKLTAQPIEIAEAIFKAQQKQKNSLYYPKKWKWIMLIIKHIPEFTFKKLDL